MIRIAFHPGVAENDINADIANSACAAEAAKPGHIARSDYQWGRALLAKHELTGARRQFELAVSKGYPAARIDLGNLLMDEMAGMVDPQRAVSLYEKAWRDGVPIAAFALGRLYEIGVPGRRIKFRRMDASMELVSKRRGRGRTHRARALRRAR